MSESDKPYWVDLRYIVLGNGIDVKVDHCCLHGPGLYVIEFDSNGDPLEESLEDMFPNTDLSNKNEREEAFEEYADLLVASQEYIPIPERLC